MNAGLSATMLPDSGLSDAAGGVKIKDLCEKLALDQAMLVRTLHTSRQLVSHYLQGPSRFIRPQNARVRDFWTKLDHVFTLLLALTDDNKKNPVQIRAWFHTKNRAFGMRRPIDLVYKGELDTITEALMDILTAAHGA